MISTTTPTVGAEFAPSTQSIPNAWGETFTGDYTRPDLLNSRRIALSAKQTARQGGFGPISGRTIRETVGYKFDSMPVDSVLAEMEAPDFLKRYLVNVDKWYASLSKSAGESTLKKNAALHKAAAALADDTHAFKLLVRALRILCHRNQSWFESGNNLDLPMNGHRALLDLFCVTVTNARRMALTELVESLTRMKNFSEWATNMAHNSSGRNAVCSGLALLASAFLSTLHNARLAFARLRQSTIHCSMHSTCGMASCGS